MRIDIVTLFPEMFASFLDGSLLGAARRAGILDVRLRNFRDFAPGAHRQVDDRPFGGGPGMLLMPGPVVECVEAVQQDGERPGHVVMLTPGGRRLDQGLVEELARRERLVLVCGRYEGFDHRAFGLRYGVATGLLSVGDFVLSGGELSALIVTDAVVRLLPGALGNDQSAIDESHADDGLLEHRHYTRPVVFEGQRIPPVLLSGDHQRIDQARAKDGLLLTRALRPDLFVRRRRVKGREKLLGDERVASLDPEREPPRDAGS